MQRNLLKQIEFNNMLRCGCWCLILLLFVSCGRQKQIVTPFFSLTSVHSLSLSYKMVDNNIDSENGFIFFDSDTIKFEYGKGVFRRPEEKTIVPFEQKEYWDSVGLSKDIILSKRSKEDYDRRSFEMHYYVNDTISNKDAVWVFTKRFRKGMTGVYFYDVDKKGNNLSVYSRNLPQSKVDSFIALIKTIKFKK